MSCLDGGIVKHMNAIT